MRRGALPAPPAAPTPATPTPYPWPIEAAVVEARAIVAIVVGWSVVGIAVDAWSMVRAVEIGGPVVGVAIGTRSAAAASSSVSITVPTTGRGRGATKRQHRRGNHHEGK